MSRGLTIALVASVLVLALGVGGLAAFVFLRPATPASAAAPVAETQEQSSKKDKEAEPAFLKLKNFVTDLADKDRLRYLDVTISISCTDAVALESAKKVEPQIRDVILSQLRSKVAADLAGAAGKDKLAEDLGKALAPLLKNNLKKVYVTDLVIQ